MALRAITAAPINQRDIDLYAVARKIRRKILDICYYSQSSHIGSSFSAVEILTALYFKCMNISPQKTRSPERDRFILSKGHACPALYATLYHAGFMADGVLEGFAKNAGTLEQHPARSLDLGIEASSGSLGYGLSMGAGMALAAKLDCLKYRTFVLLGDGELNEGTTWEAAMFAAHHHLDNLVAVVDYNKIQALGKINEVCNLAPLHKKWAAMDWGTVEVQGHDISELVQVFEKIPMNAGKPTAVIAHTTKGKGVHFMEDELLWHYRCPDHKEYQQACDEVG